MLQTQKKEEARFAQDGNPAPVDTAERPLFAKAPMSGFNCTLIEPFGSTQHRRSWQTELRTILDKQWRSAVMVKLDAVTTVTMTNPPPTPGNASILKCQYIRNGMLWCAQFRKAAENMALGDSQTREAIQTEQAASHSFTRIPRTQH